MNLKQKVSPMPDFSIDPVALFNAFAAKVADEKAEKLRLHPKPRMFVNPKMKKQIDFGNEEYDNGD
jgi:hypothetical protein